ncbi:transposase family protein [Amycolatopsis sp. FBCC-B4732]|uniref:transposase family protein n=1 Tax=Amycolatopsis sp. FBCC-B4732 TaxID=3079339 RepID=UPI001FF36686|nr:transposase family protein [Amycolatopsis sp. FBCC-B4732]UOX92464.1 transposase family protein [Amycolatopsis sp. FBCC-B4732]
MVLTVLRHDSRLAHIGGGQGVAASTVRRWVLEVIALPAARARRSGQVLNRLARSGASVVLVDGTLIRTRRRTHRANRANCSGNRKQHGLVVLGVTDETGRLMWVSAVLPGRTADIAASRRLRLRERVHTHGLSPAGVRGFHGWHKDIRDTRACNRCGGACEQIVLTPGKAEASRRWTRGSGRPTRLSRRCARTGQAAVALSLCHDLFAGVAGVEPARATRP